MKDLTIVIRHFCTSECLCRLIWSIYTHVKNVKYNVIVLSDSGELDYKSLKIPTAFKTNIQANFEHVINAELRAKCSHCKTSRLPPSTPWLQGLRDEICAQWAQDNTSTSHVLYINGKYTIVKDIDFLDTHSTLCGSVYGNEDRSICCMGSDLVLFNMDNLRQYNIKIHDPYRAPLGGLAQRGTISYKTNSVFTNVYKRVSEHGLDIQTAYFWEYLKKYSYWDAPRDTSKDPEVKSCIVCIAKNEDNYIDEWIDYHLKLGVNDIFIYQNNWRANLKKKYDNVHLIEWDYTDSYAQVRVYNDFILNRRADYDYALFIDVDEFVNLRIHKNISDFLKHYMDVPVCQVTWRYFGSNGHKTVENGNYSVIDRFTRCDTSLNRMGKAFVNLKLCGDKVRMRNAHICTDMKGYRLGRDVTRSVITFYTMLDTNKAYVLDECMNIAYLNHYRVKSLEEHKERYKVKADKDSYSCKYYQNNGGEKQFLYRDYDVHDNNEVEDLNVFNFFHDRERLDVVS